MAAEFFPSKMQEKRILTEKVHQIKAILREFKVHTICESVKCPNIGECFSRPTVTFMILGNVCSRKCTFCAVKKGEPKHVDFDEKHVYNKKNDPQRRQPDITKAKEMLGWEPDIELDEGLGKTIAYFKHLLNL